MIVIKREGNQEQFDGTKIIDAISKAAVRCNVAVKESDLKKFLNTAFKDRESIGIEEIQDLVEDFLMKKYPVVAKSYIIYRSQKAKEREDVDKIISRINSYIESDNTANATIDDNANVSNKNIAILNSEIHKPENQKINFRLWEKKLRELYPDFNHKQMIEDFNTIMYPHDSSSQIGMPYCVAITMYPFLKNGVTNIGGIGKAPHNIDSFCGQFCNLIFGIASQFKGAVAVPGLFVCMDWFLRKEWGNKYYKKLNKTARIRRDINASFMKTFFGLDKEKVTIKKQLHQYFQQITYTLMQPSGSRGNQAVFWNISLFDKPFFEAMYGNFMYPDKSKAVWESIDWLQKEYLTWFNEERLKVIMAFPVASFALIYDGVFKDKDAFEYVALEYTKGNSFFTYISDSADSLSSCCRLSSKIEKPQFNFTNGQISEMTGSKNVITLNMNRIVQDWFDRDDSLCFGETGVHLDRLTYNAPNSLKHYLITILDRYYKYQIAYNEILKWLYKAGLLSVYNAGYIKMEKQYLTCGINGLNQAAEFLGIKCEDTQEYQNFCNLIFTTIKEENQKHTTKSLKWNTELTPCESAAVKLYNRDKKDGYCVPDDTNLYASYIYKPNEYHSIFERLDMHGSAFCGDNLDGGSSVHLNLDTHLSLEQNKAWLLYMAKTGCKYATINVVNSRCKDCGYIAKTPFKVCPKCGSKNVSWYDRIIGYLVEITKWAKARQEEWKLRIFKA